MQSEFLHISIKEQTYRQNKQTTNNKQNNNKQNKQQTEQTNNKRKNKRTNKKNNKRTYLIKGCCNVLKSYFGKNI